MNRNYYLFERQIREIKPVVLGKKISSVFTYRKDELIFELKNEEDFFLRAGISINTPYFLLDKAVNIKKNKFNFFSQILSFTILDISIKPFDKMIIMDLDQYKLHFYFYGRNPNIYVLDCNDRKIDNFKSALNQDTDTSHDPTKKVMNDENDLSQLIQSNPDKNALDILLSEFAALNKTLSKEILFRASIHSDTILSSISHSRISNLNNRINEVFTEMDAGHSYIYSKYERPLKLSLVRLTFLEAESPAIKCEEFKSLNLAWIKFIEESNHINVYSNLFEQCRKAINTRLNYLNRAYQKSKDFHNISILKSEAELKGNLLLSMQYQLDPGQSKIVVENIFSNSCENITIKLNPAKTIVENAQSYFAKYKDVNKHKELARIKSDTLLNDLQSAEKFSADLKKADSLADLNKLYEKLVHAGMIHSQNTSYSHPTLFHHMVLDAGWDIYIGKNAENNDALTFQFAHKWDLWFHAQGVPGSHVVLRRANKSISVPHKIIEKTAQLAAGYSKAQHSGTVPVIYTEVRYVNRIRNAPKGTVKTQNTKTIFVSPLKG